MRLDSHGNLVQDTDEWQPPDTTDSSATPIPDDPNGTPSKVTYTDTAYYDEQGNYHASGGSGGGQPPKAAAPTPAPTPTPTPAPGPGGAPPSPYTYGGGGDDSILDILNNGHLGGSAAADLFNTTNKNQNAKYYNDNRGETIGLPSGYAANVGGNWTWTNRGPEGETMGTGGGLRGTDAGGGGNDLTSLLREMMNNQLATSKGKQASLDANRAALRDTINKAMGMYSAPVNASDPLIEGRVTNYTGKVKRSLQDSREHMAERAHAEGLPTGAFDSWVGMGDIKGGQAIGDYEDSLIGDELKSRRAGLSDLIGKSVGLLGDEDTSDLQRLMGSIDSDLRSRGLDLTDKGQNQNYDLGLKGLDMSKYGIDTGASTADKNRDQQNSQFYDKFGQDEQFHNDDMNTLLQSLLLGGGGVS